jgi:hypothetical protein
MAQFTQEAKMFLRYFQRGEPISADKLNDIVNAVRANEVAPGSGYTVAKTAAGTTLNITAGASGGGGGGGAPVCNWNVVDASEPNGEGTLILKIKVNVSPIEPGGRYPTGTSAETPYKIITLGELTPSWQCVYLQIVVDQKNDILAGDDGINLYYLGNAWPESNSVIQNTYLAGITISDDGDGGTYISDITNYCPIVRVQPPPTCAFKIEDYSLGTSADLKISIRSTTIERHYPTGMNGTDTYVLTIPDTQQWWAVYAVIVTNSDGDIQFEENDITLFLESTYKESTETLTYFLLGEVNTGYDADSNRVIDHIYNSCQIPFITGAVTTSGAIIPRGRTVNCPFRVTNATQGTTQEILIQQSTVNTPSARWPLGMGVGAPDFKLLITASSYIYVKLTYVENDVIVIPEDYGVTIAKETTLKENTVNEEYILLAVVAFANNQITTITNSCMNVTANPCNLKWN